MTVKVTAAGGSTTLPGVPCVLELKPGPDNILTSTMGLASGGAPGTVLNGWTDASGLLTVVIKAVNDGDRDELVVTARPGTGQNQQTLPYATVRP